MITTDSSDRSNDAFLDFLIRPGEVHEVRALGVKRDFRDPYERTVSGFFADREAMLAEAGNLDQGYWQKHGHCPGVYLTVNPVDPALLARANNKLLTVKGAGDCARDENIIRRANLLLDFDPARIGFGAAELKKIMATDGEKEAARRVAEKTTSYLRAAGFPEPAILDSGNGVQVLYGLDWEVAREDDDLVHRLLLFLDGRFGDEHCRLDTATANRSRICRMPGTWNRKGDRTEQRPHRQTAVLGVPEVRAVVPRDLIEAMAPGVAKVQVAPRGSIPTEAAFAPLGIEPVDASAGRWTPERLEAALEVAGIGFAGPMSEGHRVRYDLDPCPFNPDHTGRDAVIFLDIEGESAGRVAFSCFHAGCAENRWPQLRDRLNRGESPGAESPRWERFEAGEPISGERGGWSPLASEPGREAPIISASTPLATAREILARLWTHQEGPTLHQRGKSWWQWDGTRYVVKDDEDIRATVYRWLDRCRERVKVGNASEVRPFRPSAGKVNEVLDALRSLCLAPAVDMPAYLGSDPGFPAADALIPVLNELLDIDAYLAGRP